MRAQPRWGVLPLLAAPVGSWALGLGEIELQSALNQPLQAQIALVSPTPEDLEGLSVTLANQATFERYGLERPGFLSNLSFRLGRDERGRDVILVSSTQAITEPFVTMLVEATWPSGRSLREYTVLLDPPLLLPEPAVEAPVQPAQSRSPEAASPGGPIRRPAPAPQPAPQAAPQPEPQAAPQPAPRPALPATRPPAAVADGGSYGPVQRAQTLWGIASQLRPSGVTINQMMIAIYQANPQAFGDNINLLLQGAVLRIPDAAEATDLSAANATAEVQRQNDAWQSPVAQQARLRLVPPADEPAAFVAGGDTSATSAEVESLRDELGAVQAELEESRRLLELRNEELQQLQNQLADARAAADAAIDAPEPPAAADPGVDLEVEEQVFADESPAEAVTDEAGEESASGAETASTRTPGAVTTTNQEPSLVSRVVDLVLRPFVLIGVGVGVLLVAALLFLRRKREEDDDVTGQWDALEAEAEAADDEIAATTRLRDRTAKQDDFVVVEGGREERESDAAAAALLADDDHGDGDVFERTLPQAADETLSNQTVINLDQADPIAEADFHMAYGLYDQAAELVSKALEAQPDNRSLKLKLLEVFFVWGNKEAFLETAQALRGEMGDRPDGDWDKVIIMGKQICPDEALFADATAAAGEVDLDLEAGESGQALDLAFDEPSSDEDTGAHITTGGGLDLDFGDDVAGDLSLESTDEDTEAPPAFAEDASSERDDSLDIGAQTSAGLEAALFGATDDSVATMPNAGAEIDSLAETQESPTVETPHAGADDEDWSDDTMENQTVETSGPTGDTVEISTFDDEEDGPTGESPVAEISGADLTAEINLDDLGLDVGDLEDLPADLGDLPSADAAVSDARAQPGATSEDDDTDLLSATGVTQVLHGDEDGLESLETAVLDDDDSDLVSSDGSDEQATMLASRPDDDSMSGTFSDTEVLEPIPEAADDTRESSVDLDLDDLASALAGGDTVEEPGTSPFDVDVFEGGGQTPVDLDVGDDVTGSDDPTGTEAGQLEAQTMTEVGTKLDLARAYIDMGDPDGARSILEEVLDEGDSGQQREAQTLMEALSA